MDSRSHVTFIAEVLHFNLLSKWFNGDDRSQGLLSYFCQKGNSTFQLWFLFSYYLNGWAQAVLILTFRHLFAVAVQHLSMRRKSPLLWVIWTFWTSKVRINIYNLRPFRHHFLVSQQHPATIAIVARTILSRSVWQLVTKPWRHHQQYGGRKTHSCRWQKRFLDIVCD